MSKTRDRVKTMIAQLGTNPTRVAHAARISPSIIHEWLKEERDITVITAEKIVRALVNMEKLDKGTDQ